MISIQFTSRTGFGTASEEVRKAVSMLVKEELQSLGQKFVYFLTQSITEDGKGATRLERMEHDLDGLWVTTVSFIGEGDEALPLLRFYGRFLQAKGPRQMRIGVMLAQGITSNEDFRAGAGVRDIEKMFAALAAHKESGFGLHFFINPQD